MHVCECGQKRRWNEHETCCHTHDSDEPGRCEHCWPQPLYRMDMALVGRRALQLLGCWARSAVQLARARGGFVFWISRRTSAKIVSTHSRLARSLNCAKRWLARCAKRQTNAKNVHALHACRPFLVPAGPSCQAVNSACGFRSAHWLHCQ